MNNDFTNIKQTKEYKAFEKKVKQGEPDYTPTPPTFEFTQPRKTSILVYAMVGFVIFLMTFFIFNLVIN